MGKKHLDKPVLKDYKVSIVEGGGCPCEAGMTQAVVELSNDISSAMPRMSRVIEGCAYNPEANIMGFRVEGMGVIVESQRITINNAEDEATARRVTDWLRDVANTADVISTG